jgi:hypothetical protein
MSENSPPKKTHKQQFLEISKPSRKAVVKAITRCEAITAQQLLPLDSSENPSPLMTVGDFALEKIRLEARNQREKNKKMQQRKKQREQLKAQNDK